MAPSRRELVHFAAGLGLAALLPAPGAAEAASPRPIAPLDGQTRRLLGELLRTFYGEGGEHTDAVAALEEGLAWLAEDRQELVVRLPGLFDQLSRVVVPTWWAWSELDDPGRLAAVEDWARSSLAWRRSIHGALRQLLLFHAHTDPSTWESIGYPGPWLGRLDLPVHPLRFGGLE